MNIAEETKTMPMGAQSVEQKKNNGANVRYVRSTCELVIE